MNQKTFRRPNPRPSSNRVPELPDELKRNVLPNVVGVENVGPRELKAALHPYRWFPSVSREMDALDQGGAA